MFETRQFRTLRLFQRLEYSRWSVSLMVMSFLVSTIALETVPKRRPYSPLVAFDASTGFVLNFVMLKAGGFGYFLSEDSYLPTSCR